MGIRRSLVVALSVLAAAGVVGCSSDDDSRPTPGTPSVTTAAECLSRVPDDVLTTLGWTPVGDGAEATQRGCRREAEEGYVEVRDRPGGYDRLCATLDRTGGVAAGVPADWLGELLGRTVTACAVEPDAEVGATKVALERDGGAVTEVTVAVLSPTPRAQVREAVAALIG
ncbi:hypothetical protein [Nocardioides flavescens]|uniref:DUF3558 domain-containing protein n=1 Tax=Nocardioides flavescens TaxID=2691959 RepID=A0A6L7EQB0_9ACTN|nr:hypothetical protein [Nocardioides flavescens]MXG89493.1 hypothetical protein [Nocardioides flavescens]